jgi:hypothetical protein
MKINAKWIWKKQKDYNIYNQAVIAKKEFVLHSVAQADIIITADSYYRLYINDVWVNDGPCRSWPEHFQYDQFDVTGYLKPGNNQIKVIARYFGVGDFHRIPQQAGLLVQLDVKKTKGITKRITSDKSWLIAEAKQWISNTPKISVQMEPAEYYDARLEENLHFTQAVALFEAKKGPWKNLNPRDVAYMTKEDFALQTFVKCSVVKRDEGLSFCLPAARLCHPDLIEANNNTSIPCGMATVISVKKKSSIIIDSPSFDFTVSGRRSASGKFALEKGAYLIVAMSKGLFDHHGKEKMLSINGQSFKLQNPLEKNSNNKWCFILLDEFLVSKDDMRFVFFREEDTELSTAASGYKKVVKNILKNVKDTRLLKKHLARKIKTMPPEKMFVLDPCDQFQKRTVIKDAGSQLLNPSALMADNPDYTTIKPTIEGDVELLYDLGEQNCGYYSFDLIADAGVCVDIYGIEYITPSNKIQHTWGNRNGMRYVTKAGVNQFISLKRRSGRYIFITIRNQKSAVKIRNFKLIESTYPINSAGSFQCSDQMLNKVWEISARTLKLCMEDAYTDCPLYEQTLWVGDARNESLFAYSTFGAYDLATRCIKLAAQSLERYPIVGCQVPSSWDCLLPAWSFLWGISVWEYYWHTGDVRFLKEMWPAVINNLKGAHSLIDGKTGLFSGPFWNMFDWTGIDQDRKTVLHNSMFVVGAIESALKSAKVIGDNKHTLWLKQFKKDIKKTINACWDNKKKSYPDSIYDNGLVSDSTCQHTNFLSILYDIIEKKNLSPAIRNITNPPKDMIRVGSPFAMLYLYETFEKLGMEDKVIESIHENFQPMLDLSATTLWETFSTGTMAFDEFPTRSHCHGWSSSPLYFLSRIILGIKQIEPGSKVFEISPRLNGLKWAHGKIVTPLGVLKIDWKVEGKKMYVQIKVPAGIKVNFKRNESFKDLQTKVNVQIV